MPQATVPPVLGMAPPMNGTLAARTAPYAPHTSSEGVSQNSQYDLEVVVHPPRLLL